MEDFDLSDAKTARSGKTTKSKIESLKQRYQQLKLRHNNIETEQEKIAEMALDPDIPADSIQAYIDF
jgi:hypothetical protein